MSRIRCFPHDDHAFLRRVEELAAGLSLNDPDDRKRLESALRRIHPAVRVVLQSELGQSPGTGEPAV